MAPIATLWVQLEGAGDSGPRGSPPSRPKALQGWLPPVPLPTRRTTIWAALCPEASLQGWGLLYKPPRSPWGPSPLPILLDKHRCGERLWQDWEPLPRRRAQLSWLVRGVAGRPAQS